MLRELFHPETLLQIVCGLFLIPHIVSKMMMPPPIVEFFEQAGLRPARFFMVSAAAVETVALIGLTFGIYPVRRAARCGSTPGGDLIPAQGQGTPVDMARRRGRVPRFLVLGVSGGGVDELALTRLCAQYTVSSGPQWQPLRGDQQPYKPSWARTPSNT